jgi:hypothetical protein
MFPMRYDRANADRKLSTLHRHDSPRLFDDSLFRPHLVYS